ncbi:ABC transporter ATP-binding protein [Enterococcus saccharolyticus]|uniref:ABC transporter ATP-binding protein n=1 Tax=Enterococcus saccharolyticus TaxID=41997 RepID=UPI001E60CC6B|nr:ABC transporter ATP-binding protein [Enterococcus saccharolyticus]MCD5000863.1 ABC transporter ATP-binding protein [Enterococcus saccharolyticus]
MKLEINNVTKKIDQQLVIDNLSMRLQAGVYGLLGANGSGKTTLFKLICGITRLNSGEILYNGQDIAVHADEFRSILGFLPQDFSYYPDFTGMKFMLYIAALKGLKGKLAKQRCIELLELVGLADVKGKKIKKYSGGMKQRLGIAQALINDPEVLILDEPTVGLDPKERVRFRNLLSSLAENKIILLSTHIVSDVEYISDEILIINGGMIQNRGSVSELVQEIEGKVWEVLVQPNELTSFYKKYAISNQKSQSGGIVLRVVAQMKPAENAQNVQATLEDLYLYYFREGGLIQ